MKLLRILALLLAFSPPVWADEMEDGTDIEMPPPPVDTAAIEAPTADSSPPLPDATVIAPTPTEGAVVPPPAAMTTIAPARVETSGPTAVSVDAAAHRVVTGDTLWDLAGSYLQDPFQWPKIYDANRSRITNPDLIYPDQELVIPSRDAAAAMDAPAETPAPVVEDPSFAAGPETAPATDPEPVPAAEPSAEDTAVIDEPAPPAVNEAEEITSAVAAAKKKAVSAAGAGFMGGVADTFIADENWEYDGYIIRDRELKMMISQGDVVYLNVGASAGVKSKMVAHVFRVGRKVKDPYLKKPTGRLVKRVGTVVITGHISDEGCTAVVTNSLEPIRIGDIVKFLSR
ncbi:MAG: LysM peptidoglycan-binding domain-containing protein [Elusimicrobia bacterium]|nr:LysM peptidoglycan-binding domain-containing protein [Elusimicrobiota bacterium]MBK7545770.1 LysM peptidoglycan-binding domain-containing protein [Elusimicrobiota bacterium]MBK7575034.1 LysM peptidoglycan-binding domain-containing protein [Elusimicrobiota bacterium]MBK7687700.1 LysM peptidoglycan-binding domain-containing protein [Elusimicrobiota bacterium]MBK8125380.1 LysM peptidoglycan-binding domain-containing protein [Elusimicrobiota bacterium]